MARGTKKQEASGSGEADPEAAERKRLKRLAFSNNILSETSAKSSVHLNPSNIVLKHHGKDILKKSQRKNRYLFSFPGLLAPISGGKIGELKNLSSKNPILYLDFPQGQMKLFGTIVYPKNRYLTLQFSKGGKNVMCEDVFDNMIVFSDAWWIGRKEDNPQEARLEFPKELYEGQQVEYDFKGGAGATSVAIQSVSKTRVQRAEQQSPKTPNEDDLSDSENNTKDTKEVVPVRHSERTARKSYKFVELSSGDDSAERSPDLLEPEEKVAEVNAAVDHHSNVQKENPNSVVVDIDSEDAVESTQLSTEKKKSTPMSKSKKMSQFASATVSKEVSSSKRSSLVQSTLSTLFKKVEEKKSPRNAKKSPSSKVSSQKLQHAGSKRKIELDEGSRKKDKKIKDKDPGENIKAKGKEGEVEDNNDDDIDELSSGSENSNGSDEDWTA
ncbi:hypothetical protein L6164_008182 [Bauhinia variegata]|uniref:Uncharacterized protein n=1 Tax=Bauhinia variegata TaxID=167791 RepID=A0ACB9PG07_BAUVA|nr:hypothetical protein L6164_008182 [Bauhinia variegata]